MEEYVKEYHYKREQTKSWKVSEKERIQMIRKQLFQRYKELKKRLQEFERENLTIKVQETLEMADEFIEKCEQNYGEEFQRIYRADDNKVVTLYNIFYKFECELQKFKINEKVI